MIDYIIKIGSLITALLAVGGVVVAVIKWITVQNKQSDEIAILKKCENDDIQAIKNELCVLSYAVLAALDGLMQLHCNGNVTKAHEQLENHLNQTAHGQNHKDED